MLFFLLMLLLSFVHFFLGNVMQTQQQKRAGNRSDVHQLIKRNDAVSSGDCVRTQKSVKKRIIFIEITSPCMKEPTTQSASLARPLAQLC